MHLNLPLALMTWLTGTAAIAQELSVEAASPAEGNLLIHSGTFQAQRSLVESRDCQRGERDRRRQTAEVRFDPPFRDTPQVIVSLNMLDFGVYEDETHREVRVRARVDNITPEGMRLIVATWCDTNMYGAAGTYLAMGERGEALDDVVVLPASPPLLDVEPVDPAEPSEPSADQGSALPEQW